MTLEPPRDNTVRAPRARWWMWAIAVLIIAGLFVWSALPNQDRKAVAGEDGVTWGDTPEPRPAPSPGEGDAGAVGTTGTLAPSERGRGVIVTEIETITGTHDPRQLVGRRVDLHVDVQERANDVAFWVGSRDNRVLVVLAGDRTARASHEQPRASHGILPVQTGQNATISGVVRPIPQPEERFSWRLTERQEDELQEKGIYIRAEEVSSNGHGAR